MSLGAKGREGGGGGKGLGCAGRRRSDDGKRQDREGTSIQNHGGRARRDG